MPAEARAMSTAASSPMRLVVVGAAGIEQVDAEEVGAVLVAADVAQVQDVLRHILRVVRLGVLVAEAIGQRGLAPVGSLGAEGDRPVLAWVRAQARPLPLPRPLRPRPP